MITMPVAHGLSDAEMAVFLGLVIGVPAFFVGADVLYRVTPCFTQIARLPSRAGSPPPFRKRSDSASKPDVWSTGRRVDGLVI
jgi:hypothetical protein